MVHGLLMGKLSYMLGHCFDVRLTDESPSGRAKKLQVIINDAARLITSCRRREHVRVQDLLKDAKLPTVNNIVIRESAMTAWHALSPNGGGSPLSELFDGLQPDERTRGAVNGLLRTPDDGRNRLIKNAVLVCNRFPDLAAVKSPTMARSYIRKKVWPNTPV